MTIDQGLGLLGIVATIFLGGLALFVGTRSVRNKRSNQQQSVGRQAIGVQAGRDQYVGGQGGQAPGAGGGGGGALGEGTQGGAGGPGGKRIFKGWPGIASGAGGGGGGVEGEDVVGGQGGAGGDHLDWLIGPEEMKELRAKGFHHMAFRVGEGGTDGGPGEDSIIHLMTEEDKILETVIVKGGRAGAPQSTSEPKGRFVTTSDTEAGFRVTSLLTANCVHQNNGLNYIMGCPTAIYTFQTNTFEAFWPIFCVFSLGDASRTENFKLSVTVVDPTGFPTAREDFIVYALPEEKIKTRSAILAVKFTGSKAGEWIVKIVSDDIALAQIEIEVITQPAPIVS